MSLPLVPVAEGLRVQVRLVPRARRTHISGLVVEPDGRTALKVAVVAPLEGGKANAALIDFLAKSWRLPKTALALVAGHADRRKSLLIRGDGKALLAQIAPLLAAVKGADRGQPAR